MALTGPLLVATLLTTVTATASVASGGTAHAVGTAPEIIAHRGGLDRGTENSVRTITQAFASGADAIEFDVRFTKDLRTVVMHDATMNRTTNCSGTVTAISYAKFRSCKLTDGTAPPNIYQVLMAVRDAKQKAYVHIRGVSSATKARKIMRALEKYRLNDGRHAVVIGTDKRALTLMKQAGSKKRGLLFSDPKDWAADYSVLLPYQTPVTKSLVANAQRAGREVVVVEDHPTQRSDVLGLALDGYLANDLQAALLALRKALRQVDTMLDGADQATERPSGTPSDQ